MMTLTWRRPSGRALRRRSAVGGSTRRRLRGSGHGRSPSSRLCGETKAQTTTSTTTSRPLSARLRRTSIKPAVRGGLLDLGDGLPSDDESLANSNDSTEVNDNLESFGAVRSNGDDDDDDDDDDNDDDDEEERHPGYPQLRRLENIAEMSGGDDDDFLDNSHGGRRRRRRGLKKDLA